MSDEILQQLQFMGFDWLDVMRAVNEKLETHTTRIAELEAALKEIRFLTTEADGAARAEALIDEVLAGGKDE